MPINVAEALDMDTAEIVTVERNTGTIVDGLWVPGTPTTFKTMCSVQQPTYQQLKALGGGERQDDTRFFISKKPVRTAQDKDGLPPDIIRYQGNRYKLVQNGDWSVYGHNSAIGVRVDE